jgi:hypothetical protein
MMAGLMNGWRIEFGLEMQAVGEQVFLNPPRPENNIVKIPAALGAGKRLDAEGVLSNPALA